jgi:hypothetical protein
VGLRIPESEGLVPGRISGSPQLHRADLSLQSRRANFPDYARCLLQVHLFPSSGSAV